MKKMIMMMLIATCCNATMSAQSNAVDKVLNDLKVFVDAVRINETTTRQQIDSIGIKFKMLKNEYKYVKREATDEQAKEYSYLATQYRKKLSEYRLNKTGDAIDRTADKVGKWGRRQVQKMKGTVEGLTD